MFSNQVSSDYAIYPSNVKIEKYVLVEEVIPFLNLPYSTVLTSIGGGGETLTPSIVVHPR